MYRLLRLKYETTKSDNPPEGAETLTINSLPSNFNCVVIIAPVSNSINNSSLELIRKDTPRQPNPPATTPETSKETIGAPPPRPVLTKHRDFSSPISMPPLVFPSGLIAIYEPSVPRVIILTSLPPATKEKPVVL